ncbi:hypothetical protein J1605_005870 [Eschrichtius robustus]|uniref:Solute carrier family 15 member 1 n=1 Tax=Eschrichtius robustus TaxID=9764 RepID=A0AB34H6H6_ESCRO|nr:hypothetical protein J1605_005870 [Eschrichtius robustus]
MEIQPDQMQTVNAILIIILVPIMDAVVYPLIAKCGFSFTSLKRMVVGMLLASMAFVAAAIVQVEIEKPEVLTCSLLNKELSAPNANSAETGKPYCGWMAIGLD